MAITSEDFGGHRPEKVAEKFQTFLRFFFHPFPLRVTNVKEIKPFYFVKKSLSFSLTHRLIVFFLVKNPITVTQL